MKRLFSVAFIAIALLIMNGQKVSAQTDEVLAVIGNVVSIEDVPDGEELSLYNSQKTYKIYYSVLVNLNVKEVAYGNYDNDSITFYCKIAFADYKLQNYDNILCFLKKIDDGKYVADALYYSYFDVYEDNNMGWVAAAFSGENYLPYTYTTNKKELSLSPGQGVDAKYLKERLSLKPEYSQIPSYKLELDNAYTFSGDLAIPKYGYPVSYLVDYIIDKYFVKHTNIPTDNGQKIGAVGTYSPVSTVNERIKNKLKTPDKIDLGLSVEWGSFNLGATKPEEFGGYYAWGEIEQKAVYTPENYRWVNRSKNILTKYVVKEEEQPIVTNIEVNGVITSVIELYDPILPTKGEIDGKTVLESSDDAATFYLGKGWRTPTAEEIQELIDNCEWTLHKGNGEINGYIAKSKINGKTIFFPFAGWWSSNGRFGTDQNVQLESYYMSSTLSTVHIDASLALRLRDPKFENQRGIFIDTESRCDGISIRPVYDPSLVSLAEKYKDSEFLHVDIEPNTTPNFTEEENIIIGKALSRIDLRYTKDGLYDLSHLSAADLNMSEELFNHIKSGFEYTNTLRGRGLQKK